MKLRGWTILWTALGVAAAGAACVWALIHFNLLPMQADVWMDLYTGNMRVHRTCAGLTVRTEALGNFSSGLVPGGNLATYDDPEGRAEWIKISDSTSSEISDPFRPTRLVTEFQWPGYKVLHWVAMAINSDPRPGLMYDPPNGYSTQAKRHLLLNCLQIARETRDAILIEEYYLLTVETLRPLKRKAYPDDLPDVEEFLAAHKTGSGS